MIINQNNLAILRAFSNLKRNYENRYTKETTSKAATTEFISKIPNRKKISNEQLNEIIESINSQTNNESPGNDGLTAEFYR